MSLSRVPQIDTALSCPAISIKRTTIVITREMTKVRAPMQWTNKALSAHPIWRKSREGTTRASLTVLYFEIRYNITSIVNLKVNARFINSQIIV